MATLSQQIAAAPGQPSSVRIGIIDSTDPIVVTAQGTEFTDVGFIRGYTPTTGDVVALLGQSSASGSDPGSWLCLGAIDNPEAGQVLGYQAGNLPLSFGPATSFTTVVVFPQPFPSGTALNIFTNINSGVGATANWHSRAINQSNTQFTLFVFGPSSTWTNVNVQWGAFPSTSS